jgi:hypothetical protein
MNFDCKLKEFNEKINSLTEGYNALLLAYSEARNFTESFLECCEKHGINAVAIQASSPKIPKSMTFPFGTYGNIFASEHENNTPAIWIVAREMGIDGGAGNEGQYQLSSNGQAKLIDGVYTLKDGCWKRENG